MRRPTYLALAIAAIAIMLLIVFALRRYLPHTGIELAPKRPPAVVLSMNDVYLVGLDRDGKQWSTKAKRVEIGQDRSITRLTDVHDGKVFDKDKVMLKVKAGKAVYRSYNKNLQLAGGVEVLGTKGQKITGAGVDWNSSTQTLRSRGQVNLTTGSTTMLTDGLRVDLRSKELDMWNVNMRFKVDDIPEAMEAVQNAR